MILISMSQEISMRQEISIPQGIAKFFKGQGIFKDFCDLSGNNKI